MRERLTGPCCVLQAAMNIDGAGPRAEAPESLPFRLVVAAAGAIGFAALFLL